MIWNPSHQRAKAMECIWNEKQVSFLDDFAEAVTATAV